MHRLLMWIASTTVAIALSTGILFKGDDLRFDLHRGFITLLGHGLVGLCGAGIGLAQIATLHPRLRHWRTWMLASAVGWGTGFVWSPVYSIAFPGFLPKWFVVLTISLLDGCFLGFLQWAALYREFRGFGVWMVASALAAPAACFGFMVASSWGWHGVAAGGLAGLSCGTVSGIGSSCLRRTSVEQPPRIDAPAS